MRNKTSYTEIEGKALWYLQRYATSSENLRIYLKRKVQDTHLNIGSDEIINTIISSLEHQKILDDKLFSESKIRNFLNRGWSLKKIQFRLRELRVKNNIIEECIAEAKVINKDFDLVAAAKLARKKSIGPFRKKELNDKTKNKELGILSRAGFSYNIIKQVLFESDIEELEELYDQR